MKSKLINNRCHDCGIIEGQTHEKGCDMEICPFCHSQLISCKCVHKKFRLPFDSEISATIEGRWEEVLKNKGKIPYIQYPNICAKCGELWPELFMVSDEEWKYYIQPDKKDEVICKSCFTWIKTQIDKYNKVEKYKLGE